MNTLFGECHAPLNARQMATAPIEPFVVRCSH